MGHADFELGLAEVRRLSPEGEVLWTYSREAFGFVGGLALAANGDLVLVSSTVVTDEDRDALIVGLDPADGSERWTQTYSGPAAPNGYSLDLGGPVVVDEQGRRFIALHEFSDWDTLLPVVVAYAPGDSGAPLWIGEVESPGKQFEVSALTLGPEGTVVLGYRQNSGTTPFTLASFDVDTGALLWTFERDDLAGAFSGSIIRGLAASEDRIMAVGSWFEDGGDSLDAFTLGLDPDGTLICRTILAGTETLSLNPAAIVWTGADFFVSGFAVHQDFSEVELLRAKIR
jgi:outer membrane protein assembly factor BamB